MRAVQVPSFGEPEVLVLVEVPRPEPLPTEVLVRVHAAGINPVDWKTRSGQGMANLQTLPFIPGWDLSGVVEAVGLGVTTVAPGDEVYSMPWFPRPARAYAQYVTAPARAFARKPATLDHEHAAALPMAALTAWQALVDTGRLQAGQRVLIHAGAGGVGHLAVQFAKHIGAEVITTARAPRHAWLRSLGADQVVDHTGGRFEDLVAPVDLVINLVGDHDDTDIRSASITRADGLMVSTVGSVSPSLARLCRDRGIRAVPLIVEPDAATLTTVAGLVDEGSVQVFVEQTYPLDDVIEAHRHGQGNHTRGKLVLTV